MPRKSQQKPPEPQTIHGVNLSGWLVLESWVTPEIFSATGALDEQDLIRAFGAARYAEAVRRHRETFITERDFRRISARGFGAVRLPVPWYVFGDKGPLPGSFEGCIDQVDAAFDWAEASDVKILLDLAEVPAADGFGYPGQSSDALSKPCRDASLDVLCALARRYAGRDGLLGIEVLDSPVPQVRHGFSVTEGIPLHYLRNFYRDAYESIRQVAGPECVVVLSDAGLPGSWKRFMAQKDYVNVWLDCHLYHYADNVDATGPNGARQLVAASARSLAAAKESGLPVMVGEWSSALPVGETQITPEGRTALERIYTSGQLSAFDGTRAWFFQTWKTSGLLSSWDARVALSSFEREMLS